MRTSPRTPELYNELRLDLIIETLGTLHNRISERFPGSGLSKVARELQDVAGETGSILDKVRKPNMLVRLGIAFTFGMITVLTATLLFFLPGLSRDVAGAGIGSLLQTLESAAQDLIFLGITVYFLLTLETRLNRRISLRALRRLRSIVHIVDMHQLRKDPEPLNNPAMATPSSPIRNFTPYELTRYLAYCSELISLSSKLAALHVQFVNDPVVLDAVNDIEVLSANLCNLMWQKIVILDTQAVEA
jgi:hypothetical protein